MSGLKTKVTEASVKDFLNKISDETKKQDSFLLLDLFQKITHETPKLWGESIIGFGVYHYKSERSRQEGDWPILSFSPRKAALTLYVLSGFTGQDILLEKLGKHTKSVGCLYIKKLSDVDMEVLTDIITQSYKEMKKRYPTS